MLLDSRQLMQHLFTSVLIHSTIALTTRG